MPLTDQDRSFFAAFGYLRIPGLLSQEIGGITSAFLDATREEFTRHTGTKRSDVSSCLERSADLCRILELEPLTQAIATLLGEDWCYYSSDGNYYSGDTSWHSDSSWRHGTCIKVPLYFDELGADSGALRVIPGTHRADAVHSPMLAAGRSMELWGIAQHEVPCEVLDSKPGDLLAMDTNIMHAAFGGGPARRMLALQFWTAFRSEEQYAELDKHMNNWAWSRIPLHSELLHRTASASLRPHLRQVAARHAVHPRYEPPAWLPELVGAASLEDQPPSRLPRSG